jgi:NADPH:quinone reductase-like Zn-dependent oxidoreductase
VKSKVIVSQVGPEPRLELFSRDCEVSQGSEGEVQVEVSLSALNFKDYQIWRRASGYQTDKPVGMGFEGIGSVRRSSSPSLKVGETLWFMSDDLRGIKQSGIQEFVELPRTQVVPLDSGLELKALELGIPFFTAIYLVDLLLTSKLQNSRILILGSETMVGKSLQRLIPEEFAFVSWKHFSRKDDIDSDPLMSRPEVTMMPGRWDAVIDCLGGRITAGALRFIRPGGTLFLVGNVFGNSVTVPLSPFFLSEISVRGVNLLRAMSESRFPTHSLSQALAGPTPNLFEPNLLYTVAEVEKTLSANVRGVRNLVDVKSLLNDAEKRTKLGRP